MSTRPSITFPDIDLNGVKGVLIDIDDTLYADAVPHQRALEACYANSKTIHDLSFTVFEQRYNASRQLVNEQIPGHGSSCSRLLAFQEMFEALKLSHAFNLACEYEVLYWQKLIGHIKVDSKAYAFLKSCYEQSIKVCAVSDMQAHIQIQKLKKLGVDQWIDYLVTSEEVGVEKPDAAIFRKALEKLNFIARDVIMIGDSEERDIEGAKNLGIKAYKVS